KKKCVKSILKNFSLTDPIEKKVSFIDEKESKNLCQFKPPTLTNEQECIDPFENEMLLISGCKSLEDLEKIKCQLKDEYNQIQQCKDKNLDYNEQLEKFSLKLDLVEQIKFELEQKLILDRKIETEKKITKDNVLARENLFDKLINHAVDLFILIDFQLPSKPYDLLNSIKQFLQSISYQKIRIALSWQNDTHQIIIDFFENQTSIEDLNYSRIDENFCNIFDNLRWNKDSINCCLYFHIWNCNHDYLSTKWNKNWIFPIKMNVGDKNFEMKFVKKMSKNYLDGALQHFRMKKIFQDLFVLKRNNLSRLNQKNAQLMENRKFFVVDDLRYPSASKSQICLKISSSEMVESHQIILAEKKKKFTELFNSNSKRMWIELFPKMKINWQFKNIYETTFYYVDLFNGLFGQVKISMGETMFFYDSLSKETWYANVFENSLEKKEINTSFLKNNICQAFMHFCFIHSGTELIIFDLGPKVLKDDCVQFTEPVIQTKSYNINKYSQADLGKNGIEFFFFKKHRCNHLCEKFI
ncbi:hypothetical protein BpHYR1_044894, partial [Brachionus plicatilis]